MDASGEGRSGRGTSSRRALQLRPSLPALGQPGINGRSTREYVSFLRGRRPPDAAATCRVFVTPDLTRHLYTFRRMTLLRDWTLLPISIGRATSRAQGDTVAGHPWGDGGTMRTRVSPLLHFNRHRWAFALGASWPVAARNFALTLAGLLFALAACSSDNSTGSGSFTLTLAPTTIKIGQPGSGHATVTVTRTGIFAE